MIQFLNMKKKTPKSNKETMIRDQYTVVLEGLRSDFKVFGESLSGLDIKVETSLEKVNQKLDSHTEMIGSLMIDVQEIKNDLKQKVDRNEFAKLEKRVLMLEHKKNTS